MISRDPSQVFSRNSNSPIVRYGDSQYRDQQMRGQSGYPGSSGMSSYESVPRYPGSDAPGYSAGGTSSASYQSYGASQGFPGSSQYPSQPVAGYGAHGAHGAPAADSRYAGTSTGASYNPGFGSHQQPMQAMQDTPYVSGSNYGVFQDSRQDVRMQDAPGQSRPGFPSGGPQPTYGNTTQGYSSYPQPQNSTQTSAPFAAQPVDAFYGRGAYTTTTPTTQAASDFVASPATNQIPGYSPAPEQQYEEPNPNPRPSRAAASSSSTQAQMGNSGSTNPQRRERSDRDREDRPTTDKYSRSSHHHRRG